MTKDVLISISGLQFAEGENSEPVEVITSGSYYKKNGKHYILYDEVAEDTAGTTKNIIKLGDEVLDITKRGETNVHMMFEKCHLLLYAVRESADRNRRHESAGGGDGAQSVRESGLCTGSEL